MKYLYKIIKYTSWSLSRSIVISFVFQENMPQKVLLVLLLCVLQFRFYHSRYLLVDVDGEGSGLKAAGCGDWCWAWTCTKDPDCPVCAGFIGGICIYFHPPNSTIHNWKSSHILILIISKDGSNCNPTFHH